MTTTSINTVDAKEKFSELINRVSHHKERIILIRRDKAIAAIIPLDDLALIEQEQTKLDLEEAAEALKEAKTQGTLSLDELKAELENPA